MGSVSRVGQNPAPIKQRSWRKNILLVSVTFCISFVLAAKDTGRAMGSFEWYFRKLDAWHPYWSPHMASVEAEVLGGYENNITPA